MIFLPSLTTFTVLNLVPSKSQKITDYVLEEQENWQNRTLAPIKCAHETKECAVYNILGIRRTEGNTGLEEGAKAIFPEVVVQRCIVHLIRNSLKYVPTRDFKDFTHLKKIYGAASLKLNVSVRSGQNIPAQLLSGNVVLPMSIFLLTQSA